MNLEDVKSMREVGAGSEEAKLKSRFCKVDSCFWLTSGSGRHIVRKMYEIR
jgi:hypothetical protein